MQLLRKDVPPLPLSRDLRELYAALEDHIPEYKLAEYMNTLSDEFCDTAEGVATLTLDELREMRISVGHRRRLLVAARQLSGIAEDSGSPGSGVARGSQQVLGISEDPQRGRSWNGRPTQPPNAETRAKSNPLKQMHRNPVSCGDYGLKAESDDSGTSSASDRPVITSTIGANTEAPPSILQRGVLTGSRLRSEGRHAVVEERVSSASSNPNSRHSSFRRLRRKHDSAAMLMNIQEELEFADYKLQHTAPAGRATHEADAKLQSTAKVVDAVAQKVLLNESEVEWLCLSGQRETLQQFLYEMNQLRKFRGFPSTFDRLFFDNKPMPFVETSEDSQMIGLLLRIPDLSDEHGTNIATITNRVVLMVHREARLIVTYHACEEDPFEDFHREWESGRHALASLERVVETMVRRVLRTYNKGVILLRQTLDELESRDAETEAKYDDTKRVQLYSLVSKKASVYKRCAAANHETLTELGDVEWMESFVKSACDGLATVSSMSDELSSNALSSIDLTIALAEFKSSANLKSFTYMTILLQPVAVGTSWYGMNWSNMPELEFEEAYFYFTGAIWILALIVFSQFILREKIIASVLSTLKSKSLKGNSGDADAKRDDDGPRPWRRASKMLRLTSVGASSPGHEASLDDATFEMMLMEGSTVGAEL